ncbi:MAG: hypothetical protein MUF45_15310 [Spirosomaceae bacterium]|nr:hypothetical protein [Spirosomataceae bacterium]
MKKLGTIVLILLSTVLAKAAMPKDTTTVEFTDKGVKKRVTVQTAGKRDFDLPRILSLDNILRAANVDSAERQRAIVLIGQKGTKQDTILVVSRDGNKIKIVAKDPAEGISKDGEAPSDTLINKNDDDHFSKDDDDEDDNEDGNRNWRDYTKKKSSSSGRFFSRSDFGIYIGLNNWTQNGGNIPSLKTWGSRYFALSWRRNATLVNGKKMDLAFSYGPEIAWNNFMFDGNTIAQWSDSQKQVSFVDAGKSLDKSKLVVPTLNFPMMLNFGFEEARFNFGIGGYVGYRIGGYTKIKEDRGSKDHDRNSFGLNDFRYGLTAELGRKSGTTFFFRYDMNELFKENQINAKGIQAWSVGIRL